MTNWREDAKKLPASLRAYDCLDPEVCRKIRERAVAAIESLTKGGGK
jgi:hypothetical protein